MIQSLLPLTIQDSTEYTENVDANIELDYTYDCWRNESYDSDFLLSCAVTMLIYIYIQFIDYIAKKYLH